MLLAGCASLQPFEPAASDLEGLPWIPYRLAGSPLDVADCVDKNIRTATSTILLTRRSEAGSAYQVIAHSATQTKAVISVYPAAPGSIVFIRLSKQFPFKEKVANMVVEDC